MKGRNWIQRIKSPRYEPGNAPKLSSADYECMDDCFGSRPVPPGSTRMESFCIKCQARQCGIRPELTPAQKYVQAMVQTGRIQLIDKRFRGLIPWALDKRGE